MQILVPYETGCIEEYDSLTCSKIMVSKRTMHSIPVRIIELLHGLMRLMCISWKLSWDWHCCSSVLQLSRMQLMRILIARQLENSFC